MPMMAEHPILGINSVIFIIFYAFGHTLFIKYKAFKMKRIRPNFVTQF